MWTSLHKANILMHLITFQLHEWSMRKSPDPIRYMMGSGYARLSITRQSCGELQPPEPIEDTTSTRGRLTHPRMQPQQKQTDELLASIHTCTVSLLM